MDRLWISRLRWRMRGAWMWKVFIAATLAEGLVIHALPLAGEGTQIFPAMLLAGFLNLVTVALLAPLGGRFVRRRRPDLPKIIAADYAGTALLVAVGAILLAVGLAHRPARQAADREVRAQFAAVRRYVLERAPAQYHRNVGRADALRLDEHLYRACVPGDDPRRSFCLIVNTDQDPPGITVDPNRQTNRDFAVPVSSLQR